MTITLRPHQERALQQAIEAGIVQSVEEFIDAAIGVPRQTDKDSRRDAVRRMMEFGEKHRLSLGEPVTRKILHEEHRH